MDDNEKENVQNHSLNLPNNFDPACLALYETFSETNISNFSSTQIRFVCSGKKEFWQKFSIQVITIVTQAISCILCTH